MSLPLFIIDAFAERPFEGNPAAVALMHGNRDDAWYGHVAAEMNLSETAFVTARPDGEFDLRWFTPAMQEIDLCGHATLASAHALWRIGRVAADQAITFHTRSGALTARPVGGGWIELDFPADVPREVEGVPAIGEAIGEWPRRTFKGRWDYLVELEDAEAVRSLHPDFALLKTAAPRGLIVTAPSDDQRYHFISRFFAPSVGIDEDPVTGSAHCTLGPYWSARLGIATLVGFQASRRGGTVQLELRGGRVLMRGQAHIVVRGELEA